MNVSFGATYSEKHLNDKDFPLQTHLPHQRMRAHCAERQLSVRCQHRACRTPITGSTVPSKALQLPHLLPPPSPMESPRPSHSPSFNPLLPCWQIYWHIHAQVVFTDKQLQVLQLKNGVGWLSISITFSSTPENSVPPDVTSSTPQERGSRVDLPPAVRGMSRGQSRSSMLDTADGTLTQSTRPLSVFIYCV